MKPTTEILERIYQNSQANPDEAFSRLFRYMLRPDIYFLAYKNLYANKGASTNGVDERDTADGFSEEKIGSIIEKLRNGSYEPKPVRRVYIEKKNGNKRPLGLPTFTDKLVQEVLRMILEAIYEPIFTKHSHGFRPKRSCHTALKEVSMEFNGIRWFIEGDIKGCFDNIDHQVLIELVKEKVKDARIIQLLWKFLRAGYMENWRYNNSYSGTPQGGIISPILANIYLHELDKFIMKLKAGFDKCELPRQYHPEYQRALRKVAQLKSRIKRARKEERKPIITAWKKARQALMRLPSKLQVDKVIKYVRYADDFLIGVNGSREECQQIKQQIIGFMTEKLHMELSEAKTLITHSSKFARFLNYDIRVRRSNVVKRVGKNKLPKRTMNNKVSLSIPLKDRVKTFMFQRSIIEQKNGEVRPVARITMLNMTPLEIIHTYNSELRGLCNYYSIGSNFTKLNYFAYLMEYSCLLTLAAKFKTTICKIKAKYKDGRGSWGIPYETKTGKKRMYFAKYQDSKKKTHECKDPIDNYSYVHSKTCNTFEERLKAHKCELCGRADAEYYEIHHIRKLKDLKGKSEWERSIIAKRRKTIVLCRDCHKKIHGKA